LRLVYIARVTTAQSIITNSNNSLYVTIGIFGRMKILNGVKRTKFISQQKKVVSRIEMK